MRPIREIKIGMCGKNMWLEILWSMISMWWAYKRTASRCCLNWRNCWATIMRLILGERFPRRAVRIRLSYTRPGSLLCWIRVNIS